MRKEEYIQVTDCKTIPGEESLTQHRLVCMDFRVKTVQKKKKLREKSVKAWKLRDADVRKQFQRKLAEKQVSNGDWKKLRENFISAAGETCGETRGGGGNGKGKETWWWNPEVQRAIKEKRLAFKSW